MYSPSLYGIHKKKKKKIQTSTIYQSAADTEDIQETD